MKMVKDCKDVSSQEEQQRLQFSCFTKRTTVYSQNINKQNVNIADETLTDYSFLSIGITTLNPRII